MSMLSGMHPSVHGVHNYYGAEATAASRALVLLPELFQRAGYATAGFTGGGMLSRELGFGRGFDVYDDQGRGAEFEFGKAAAWLREHATALRERPFFLFAHTYQIHDPYTPPAEWQARFVDPAYAGKIDSTRIVPPADAAEVWKTNPRFYEEIQERFWGGYDGQSPADLAHLRNLYDAGIAFTDGELEKLFAALGELGLVEGALIVVTSDHGEEFSEHQGLSHQTVFQEVLRVPLIVRLPGAAGAARAGARVKRPVQGVDLLPSLCELADLALPPDVQGRSWAADARGVVDPEVDYRTWSELGTPRNEKAALVWGRYKLIGDRTDRKGALFFDLRGDPREKFNMVESFDELAVHMTKLMEQQDAANRALAPRYAPSAVAVSEAAQAALEALGYAGSGPTGRGGQDERDE
jgi:arylsulfatase A-like enzyme